MRLIFAIILLFSIKLNAQQNIQGNVLDKTTSKPISDVIVENKLTKQWVITDKNGSFSFNNVPLQKVTLQFSLIGKINKAETFTFQQLQEKIIVFLDDEVLTLDEIVISAKKGEAYSEIILGKEAIEQTQSFSLSHVLEQLPGQVTTDFDLSEFKAIVFRSSTPRNISSDDAFGNKSFGTAVVVDGIPISNNENMQDYATNSGEPFSPNSLGFGAPSVFDFNGYFSNANYGVDLRQISTDNIEKIEIVQGIPSAKYGDLTSGLIKIEQKAGRTPYKMYASFRDGASEYGISKGFKVNDKLGNINFSLSLLESNTSPRTSFKKYKRINSSLLWTWANAKKNIKNTFSINYGFNDDNYQYDDEDVEDTRVKNQKKDISFSNRFKWNANKKWFENININLNFSYGKHNSYRSNLTNSGGKVMGRSLEEGVYTGVYTPLNYRSVLEVEGIPISAFLSAELHKTFIAKNKDSYHITYGFSARMSDNKGQGRLGAPETLHSLLGRSVGKGSHGFRPYNYGKNVRAEYQYSAYIENQYIKKWEVSKLNINAGLRYDNQNSFSVVSPRLNTYFQHKKYKIRGGIGLTSKAPSLNQIYTGPRYYDVVLGDYRLPGEYNIGIVQTFIDEADNKNLKPTKSFRTELGFDYNFSFGELSITGFYNKLFNGVTSEQSPFQRALANIEIIDNNTTAPNYEITGYTSYYYLQNKLVNKLTSTDKGIEFIFSIDQLPIANLKLDLQGSYTQTITFDDVDNYSKSVDASKNEKTGVYKPFNINSEQFRVGGNLSYRIPKVGLIMSLRSEHFIIENYNRDDKNRLPYAYIDANLNKVIIPEADRSNEKYDHLTHNIRKNTLSYSLDKVYHNINLRVTKEFLNGFRFSFYANNFLDLKQTEMRYINGGYVKIIKPEMVNLSFGTKIEFQF